MSALGFEGEVAVVVGGGGGIGAAVTLVPMLDGKRLCAKQIVVDRKIEKFVLAVTPTQPPVTTSGVPK